MFRAWPFIRAKTQAEMFGEKLKAEHGTFVHYFSFLLLNIPLGT